MKEQLQSLLPLLNQGLVDREAVTKHDAIHDYTYPLKF